MLKHYFLLIGAFLILAGACKSTASTHNSKLPDSKYKLELLFQTWDVVYINAGGRKISGMMMGNPQYRFTQQGKRYKSYKEPPHTDSTTFVIRNDSIHYTGEKNFPSVSIEELTDSTLKLVNDKAEWKLYIKG